MTQLLQFVLLLALAVVGCDFAGPGGMAPNNKGQPRSGGPGPLISWHFVGAKPLSGSTNAVRLQKVLAEPSTKRLVDDLVYKAAQIVTNMVPGSTRASGKDPAALMVPLIRDLLDHESVCIVGVENGNRVFKVNLAVNLPEDRASAWIANWKEIMVGLGTAQPSEVTQDGFKGIEAQWVGTPYGSRMVSAGNWVVVSLGDAFREIPQAWSERIKNAGRPVEPIRDVWLSVEADLEKMSALFNWPKTVAWPKTKLEYYGTGPNLRTTGRLIFSEPLQLRLEPWRIPTNTISEPLVSFTAVQGVRSWLSSQQWVKEIGLTSVPNQLFVWGQAYVPFRTYAAWEMEDMSNSLRRFANYVWLVATNNLFWAKQAFVESETNGLRYVWHGLPIVEPFVQQATSPEKQFLVAGIFPPNKKVTPGPPDLYSQIIPRTNLVYYDWELSQVRVDDLRRIKETYWMIAGYESPATNTPVRLWLADTNVTRHLDNAVTEIAYVSPKELSLTRLSSIGLTSLELVLLARWLEDPEFPKLSKPRLNPVLLRHQQRPPNVPVGAQPTSASAGRPSETGSPPASGTRR